ncbi:cold-shock protein [uncultured Ligilactobacillus sp.]|uniref:cold-shock protein n=1 Tax=uncultured Ligilactobacillus sp. TaxID=2837633 RepID=UPI00272DB0B3|nr:cold shock domain-containing protein [uncultured Ligilactobacillus sp.]
MEGRVVKFFDNKGYGFITGEDGESYFFHISQLINSQSIDRGDLVYFSPTTSNKGKQARQVNVKETNKKKFITIGNKRVKLSNIKEYGSSYEYAVYEVKSEDDGGLRGISEIETDSEILDGIFFVLDMFSTAADAFSNEKPKIYYEFSHWSRYYVESKNGVVCKKVPYVWITTYQNETYRFHDERNVGLEDLRTQIDSYNVQKIIKELDVYLN